MAAFGLSVILNIKTQHDKELKDLIISLLSWHKRGINKLKTNKTTVCFKYLPSSEHNCPSGLFLSGVISMELKASTVCVSTLVKAHKDYYHVSLLTQLLHSKLSFTFSPYKNLAISLTTSPPISSNTRLCDGP